jgi:arylsulfatase A-like enzyme
MNARRVLTILLLAAAAAVPAVLEFRAAEPRKNVLLIVVDTLRPDFLSCYGNPRVPTPRIDALAASGTLFTDVSSAYPSTLPSHASLFTSTYPYVHGVFDNANQLAWNARTLAEVLHGKGWHTAGFVSNAVLHVRTRIGQGFELWQDRMVDRENNREVFERVAERTTDLALEWAKDAPAGFFLFVHYNDPHGAYVPPARFRGKVRFDTGIDLPLSPVDDPVDAIPAYQVQRRSRRVDDYLSRYAGEVLYADQEVGRLLDGLAAQGRRDDTLVVFVADHGEAMGEHGRWFQHTGSLYQEEIAVPLIVAGPGVPSGRVTRPVRTIDVMPTVLDLLRVRGRPAMQGRSLVPLMNGRDDGAPEIAYAELYAHESLRAGRMKVIQVEGRPAELYDLAADPGETHDLAAERPEEARRMREAMVAYREGDLDLSILPTTTLDDADTRARLKALGYTR